MSAPDRTADPDTPLLPPEDARALQARLWILEARVRELLTAASPATDSDTAPQEHRPRPDDTGDAAQFLEEWEARVEQDGKALRLRRLQSAFGLRPVELDVWLAVAAPHVDPRFAELYRRFEGVGPFGHATPALTARLAGLPAAAAYALWSAAAPLRAGGLADPIGPAETGFLSRPLLPAHRVVAFVLGDNRLDDVLLPAARLLDAPRPALASSGCSRRTTQQLTAAARASAPLTYVRRPPGAHLLDAAAAAFAAADGIVLHLDLRRIGPPEDAADVFAAALREARLRDCALIAGPVEALSASHDGPPHHGGLPLPRLTAPAGSGTPPPVVLIGSRPWDHDDGDALCINAQPPTAEELRPLWRSLLAGTPLARRARAWADCPLPPHRAEQAVTSAVRRAAVEQRPLTDADLRSAIRAHGPFQLERLARRIEPGVTLADLVLPDGPRAEIEDLLARARHRDLVLRTWRLSPGNARGHGIIALFSGPSGTGKTLAAEALAHALDGDLYIVNLAALVDKYIGETEKNIDQVLNHADHAPGVLLFDEADALFGKRSETKDAHDRHANTQISHLLQRLESFAGVAVLTTNLPANIDDAFTRRLDHITHFPFPDADQRRTLWQVCLGPRVPRSPDLDLDRVAQAFPLAGGSIRSCAVTAAYRVAHQDRKLTTADLVDAVETEYRKLGLLIDTDAFDALRRPTQPATGATD
ncbi:ATP-binding protein [Kitasatospora griseola]|uniref:ATP-binding protein n=1 Tax=Kitasatospora griseola TaxID=2064 RepID=UPI0036DAD279